MTPRMRYMIATFKRVEPGYAPPKGDKAVNSPFARWINGMSEETFKSYMTEEIEFSMKMQAKRAMMHFRFMRDLGKPKSVDLNTGKCEVVK